MSDVGIVNDIMKMVDHSLLDPSLTDDDLKEGCRVAAQYHTASVCVKPYHVQRAAELLKGTDVAVGGVIGFPHGNSTTGIKLAETEQIIRDGAVEADMVVNIGKVLSGDWEYVKNEISAIVSITRENKVKLKVIFENDLLPDDAYKIRLCEICTSLGVDFVKTSTGYNYLKGADGKYDYRGATLDDLQLMLEHTSDDVEVKAAGHSGGLAKVLEIRDLGVTRTGTGCTEELYQDAVARFSESG